MGLSKRAFALVIACFVLGATAAFALAPRHGVTPTVAGADPTDATPAPTDGSTDFGRDRGQLAMAPDPSDATAGSAMAAAGKHEAARVQDARVDPGLLSPAHLMTLASLDAGRTAPTSQAGDDVSISAVANGSPTRLLADLQSLGLVDGSAGPTSVTGSLPMSQLQNAGRLGTLRYIRQERRILDSGLVDSQGDAAMKADIARTKYNVDGTGEKVGIISDSFDCLHGAAADEKSDDLPATVEILREGSCVFGTDEGRAMAQIVHDVAPGAAILFDTAGDSPLSMGAAVGQLVQAGANIIVDDVAFIDEPFLQDGVVAQAIDKARAAGVTYFSAAGNSGHASYEGPFNDVKLPNGLHVHNFASGRLDFLQKVTIPPEQGAIIDLQWSDNFKAEIPLGPAVKTDLDLYAFDDAGQPLDFGETPNLTTQEPFEAVAIPNFSDRPLNVNLLIARIVGPSPRFMKWSLMEGELAVDEYATPGSTSLGHNQAAGAITVGAVSFKDTPAFGKAPPIAERYSSRGGTPMILDVKGQLLSRPFEREKPDVMAPDNANTTFFGEDSPDDADSFPNFPGTSAAAPHAAAVAALLLEKVHGATPVDVCSALAATTVPMGTKGFDFDTGNGLVDADAALGWLTAPGKKGPCPSATVAYSIKPAAAPIVIAPPKPVAAPQAPPPTPVPTPTPKPTLPPYPLLFVDANQVTQGDAIVVTGYTLPKGESMSIMLDRKNPLGSAVTDAHGSLRATFVISKNVSLGSHAVTGTTDGRHFITAATGIHVLPDRLLLRVPRSDTTVPAESSDNLPLIIITVLSVLFVGGAITLRLIRVKRKAWS